MNYYPTLFLLFFGYGLFAQSTLKAVVLGADTESPLPYANIYNRQQATGTPTNLDGYFELPQNQIGDTIVISYLGYQDRILVVDTKPKKTIYLEPNTTRLHEVVITAESDWLYEMLTKVRKNRNTAARDAKTYFYLETDLAGERVEIIEAYYNGRFEDFGATELAFKKGRIGLRPSEGRYFSTTSSSRLFSMHDLFSPSQYFPANPLQANARNTKRQFELQLENRYQDGGADIYVIGFRPKKADNNAFSGTIWVDRNQHQVRKINLQISDARPHPFIPIGFNTIQRVDMNITKTYRADSPFIDAIDFDYEVIYQDLEGYEWAATTSAFMKAYDYQQLFNLPYFEFTKQLHEDYRNITLTDYDATYWAGTQEYRFYDRAASVDAFIRENVVQEGILYAKRRPDHQQLQYPYIEWDTSRFIMTAARDSLIQDMQERAVYRTDRYSLNTKLYLDVNWVRDSLVFQTAAILDPVGTYFYDYIDKADLAFMNMYLDLLEVQRRRLEAGLSELRTLDYPLIRELYQDCISTFERDRDAFIRQTNRGSIDFRMQEWNKLIKEALGVDNLSVFPLQSSTKD